MLRLLVPLLWLSMSASFTDASFAADSSQQFRNIRKQPDPANNRGWYIPESAPTVVETPAFYLYFGKGERGLLTALRLKVVYSGKQPLGVRQFWANADGKQLISFPTARWESEQVNRVWEWIDAPIDNVRQVHDLLTLAAARQGTIYFSGTHGKFRVVLNQEQKRALRDVIAAYQASGGNLSW